MSARSRKALRVIMLVLATVTVTTAAAGGPVEGNVAAYAQDILNGQ